jgi:hypothetical protein
VPLLQRFLRLFDPVGCHWFVGASELSDPNAAEVDPDDAEVSESGCSSITCTRDTKSNPVPLFGK